MEELDGFFEFAFAFGAGFGDVFADLAELFGMENFEGEVFELPLELPDTEAGGERGVDVEGFVGDAGLFVIGHRVEGAHVVEAVGELDDHHADVAGDGEEHFAEVVAGAGGIGGRGGGFGGTGRVAGEFGDAFDELENVGTELTAEELGSELRVFEDIVEQGGDDAVFVEAELDADDGDFGWVGDVRFAVLSPLVEVGALGDFKSGDEAVGRRFGKVLAVGAEEPVQNFLNDRVSRA